MTKKLEELESLDVIEKVKGLSNGVSFVRIVPKPDNDIQLFFDMRRANTAISRVRYPIPTIDVIMQDLDQSKVFSKLDIKRANHQIELEPNSRDITTFVTHNGLYCYKRPMFGIIVLPKCTNK